jgi:hypothetical protein
VRVLEVFKALKKPSRIDGLGFYFSTLVFFPARVWQKERLAPSIGPKGAAHEISPGNRSSDSIGSRKFPLRYRETPLRVKDAL